MQDFLVCRIQRMTKLPFQHFAFQRTIPNRCFNQNSLTIDSGENAEIRTILAVYVKIPVFDVTIYNLQ